jgi:Peptidase family M23
MRRLPSLRHLAHKTAWLAWALLSANTGAQTVTAEQCRQQHPYDRVAQIACARRAHAAASSEVQPLAPPLADTQIIFDFFDRRFPGFNGGKEHLGVDFAAAAGAGVTAICDGTVRFNNSSQADVVSAVVMVEHDCPPPLGTVYGYYGHVQSVLLPGENIAAGGHIGTVRDWAGNTHLHLGLSTRLHEENWGVVPRGATLQTLAAQGWLNPLDYFSRTPPKRATRNAARPAAKRAPAARGVVPKAGKPNNRAALHAQPLGFTALGANRQKNRTDLPFLLLHKRNRLHQTRNLRHLVTQVGAKCLTRLVVGLQADLHQLLACLRVV